jgi:K(+)-stimulated pyrophosphate-energized sodium pump
MNHNINTQRVSSMGLRVGRPLLTLVAMLAGIAGYASPAPAQSHRGGEANLVLPDLSDVTFLGGIDGHNLLLAGIVVC